MGVTGLWRLIEPAGKPVPVETLENKVLAVDISIWLHQMVKGYQDAKGAPLANAHLMGLFQRLCKLLYFRIKPIFVFDGAFPDLKKETIAKRQDSKAKYHSESERLKRELALLLSKKTAVSSLLGTQISPKKSNIQDANSDDIFKLPALPEKEVESESDSDEEDSSGSIIDLHSVDVESENFKSLPIKEKYNLLIDLKETRKMNSWGKLHELPKKSDNFSDFQMQRLLKRRKVQECLQETEKEMGDAGMSLTELESLLNEEGIDTKIESLPTRRIASDSTTRIFMINNVRQALEDARKRKEALENPQPSKTEEKRIEKEPESETKDELEDDIEKAIKMSLVCGNEADISACTSKTDDSWTTFMTDSDYTDSEDDDGFEAPDMACAKAYIMQYSDFTHKTINEIVNVKKSGKSKPKLTKAEKIIQDLNKENSVIVDKVNLSSSDDEDDIKDKNVNQNEENLSSIEINSIAMDNVDPTQTAVVWVENPAPEVISLDTTTEDDIKQNEPKPDSNKSLIVEPESSSSDDEFEEVPLDLDSEFKKPVVQLTLNMDQAPGEDDIFADIFASNENVLEQLEINLESEQHSSFSHDSYHQNVKSIISVANTVNNKREPDIAITAERHSVQMEQTCKKSIANNDTIISRPSTSGVKLSKSSIDKTKQILSSTTKINEPNVPIDEEDELQRAIQMSLECVDETAKEIMSTVNVSPSTSKISKPSKEPLTTEQLNTMAEEIQLEEKELIQEKGRLDRIGRNITEQMTKEAQELLQIFGIPYIVAPMEAEAQCAFLESVNLTDGTITDDSDIWLFGGRTVYKNFFNQKKHVLQFLAERIKRSFNLTREQLVLLALLVGSDYTTGVAGVGPVTALEILASFPFNKRQLLNETSKQAKYSQVIAGLEEFKKWVKAGKRTDNTTLKKKLKNVDLNEDFPSVRVVQAYLEPNVEKSKEKFTWGELDITILRDYAKAKFGWSQSKLDEIVKPVLKRLQERKSQKSMQDYFKKKVEFQPLDEQMSKRVKAAVQKMAPEKLLEESVAEIAGLSTEKAKPVRKRKANKKATVTELENENGLGKNKIPRSDEAGVLIGQGVKIISQIQDGKSGIDIIIPKTDRFQEIIPQREKEKQDLLQNKMKAIEIFRKTKMDKKKKVTTRRVNLPKEKAELSESSDSN